jgi:hypothetical protein
MRSWLAAGVLSALSIMASSAQRPPKVTGFFTDMRYVAEAGDVLGTEVWIVYARGKFWATVQNAEGEPDPPQVVPVEVSGAQVKFATRIPLISRTENPVRDLVVEYSGTVSKAGLTLSIQGSQRTLLKRQNSYWQ